MDAPLVFVRPLSAAALAFLVVGCGTMPPLEPEWPGPVAPERSPRATIDEEPFIDPVLPDVALRAAVQERLRVGGVLAPGAVAVQVEDGVVTLSGTTRDLPARERAVELAGGVRGVRGVVDRVEVSPEERADEVIERDVRAALSASDVMDGRRVSVRVEDGVVTLAGEVADREESEHALSLASGVRGVRHVLDRLTPEPTAQASEEDIRAALERTLALDARFNDNVVDVELDGRVATLSGSVDSALERDLAADHALAAGASFVDVRRLEVGGFEDEPPRPARFVADELVADAVSAALERDPRLDDGAVRVEVEEGVATLRGTVRTVDARDSASERAREARGVVGVRNLVEVSPSSEVSDAEISARVEDALARDPWLFEAELTVLVDDGDVTLAGELPSRYARARARELVSMVEGVDDVEDRLTVLEPVRMSDEELRASVLEELFWNPNVDPANLAVEVRGGVVWLGGEARDIVAAASARESAFLAGARSVVNEIEVPNNPPDVRTTIEEPSSLRRPPFVPETPFDDS